jgi:starch synthase (maltosyl-transferring)
MPTRAATATSRALPPPTRITIRDPRPIVDAGRYPVKRCTGDTLRVFVEAFADGHDVIGVAVRWRGPGSSRWSQAPMVHVDGDRDGDTWSAEIVLDAVGAWTWTAEAWVDEFASWRRELLRKQSAAQADLGAELAEGAVLLAAAAARAKGSDRGLLARAADALAGDGDDQSTRVAAALDEEVVAAARRAPDRRAAGDLGKPIPIWVDRPRARYGSWYELFPRSWGNLRGTTAVVPEIAGRGFDVLYLTPIHPIGVTNRKGANNALTAGPDDPGSPWAIGAKEGGHEALHPELGTLADFKALVATCDEHGMEVALDLAFQCSADHPWLTQHPEWFYRRPDGTLKYAENPPKRYQDIYNFDFGCTDWRSLWDALRDVTLTWVDRGVQLFRVDNPHTKPLAFWEWLIAEVHKDHPEVIFLAEAFTRRAVMRSLAKAGFAQSYTYFTWMNTRWELEQYVTELRAEIDYLRPNLFANTPDILHAYLQRGGRPAFEARLVLAATLSPSYGIYSGFESFENVAVSEGSEEYRDSEKYERKTRTFDGPLLDMIQRVNEARREHPALQRLDGLRFIDTANDQLIAYVRHDGWDSVICVVNLDPHHPQEGLVDVPADLGLPPAFTVRDELDDGHHYWHLGGNYVRLQPGDRQAHVFAVVG